MKTIFLILCGKVLGCPAVCFTDCKCLENVLLLQLCSPESSGEADVDVAVADAGEGAEGSELYQSEAGKHIATLL